MPNYTNMTEFPCGVEILLNGEVFGQIDCWAKNGSIEGASVTLAKRPLVGINDWVFPVTHVFLPEQLPEGFTIRGKTRDEEFQERCAPLVAEAIRKANEERRTTAEA